MNAPSPTPPPRVHPNAGKIPRDQMLAIGERTCRHCGKPVTGRRRTLCSTECAHEWRLRTSPSYVRRMVYKRDRGRCALCGLHTASLRAKWNKMAAEERAAAEAEFGLRKGRRSMWDADHITPVALGGGLCGLDGYRTLCLPCHRKVTAELRLTLTARRRQVSEADAHNP